MRIIAEFIERPAGHYVILIGLVAFGVVLVSNGWNNGSTILDGSFCALLYALREVVKKHADGEPKP